MRRLCITLLCGLVAVPAAMAAARATGDGTLELQAATGTFSIAATRGTLWGQMDRGKLVVTDVFPGDDSMFVSGYRSKTTPVDAPNITIYTGANLHFRARGGRYKIWMRGAGVDLTAVGVGSATLVASSDSAVDDPGQYAIDEVRWIGVPLSPRTVSFGVQPDQATP